MTWEYVVVNICGYTIALGLLWLITRLTRDLLTFAHIFSLFWGLCILASEIPPALEQRPDIETLLVVFGGWWSFLLGSIVVLHKRLPTQAAPYNIDRRPALITLWALVALHVITWRLEMPDIGQLGANIPDIVFGMSALRIHSGFVSQLPWYLQFVRSGFIYYFPLAMLIRYNRWLSRGAFTAIIVAGCIMSLVKFTRAPLLWALMVLLVSWKIIYKPSIKRVTMVATLAGVIFGVLFLAMQTLLVKNLASTGIHASLDAYWGGSVRSYETILRGEYPKYQGSALYSLDLINYTLKKLNVIADYPELVRPYGTNSTNLYTFLDAYTLDAGIVGAMLGAFLTGALVAFVYRILRKRARFGVLVMYVTFVYFCALCTANNEFIRTTIPTMVLFVSGLDAIVMSRSRRAVPVSATKSPQALAAGGRRRLGSCTF